MERFLEVDEVVANASTFIEDMTDEMALIARQWVWFAMRDIGPSYDLISNREVEISGGSARKPEDMTGNIIDLTVYTESGQEIPYRYNYNNARKSENSKIRNILDIYEDPHFIHFSDHDPKPERVLIKYFKMPLDDCHLPLVPESHLNAVMAYIKFAYYFRRGNDSAMIGFSKNFWEQERLKVRAKNKSVAGLRAKQIVKEWMSIIPNPRYNRL